MNEAIKYLGRHGPLILFISVFAEQMGLPIPAAPLLLVAGAMAALGEFNGSLGFAGAVAACLIADTIWFQAGRYRGIRVLGLLCRISLEPDSCVRRMQNLFTRYGLRGVAASKFVPGLSTLAPPLAGVSGVPYGRFLAADALGSLVYIGLFMFLGGIFRNQIQQITDALASFGKGALVLLSALVAAYLGFKYWQRQRVLRKLRMDRMTARELRERQTAGEAVFIIDLRPRAEVDLDAFIIPGALHMALDELDSRLHEIPADQEVVLYCSCPNEVTSARTALLMQRKGIKRVRPLLGGIDAWRELNYPLHAFKLSSNG